MNVTKNFMPLAGIALLSAMSVLPAVAISNASRPAQNPPAMSGGSLGLGIIAGSLMAGDGSAPVVTEIGTAYIGSRFQIDADNQMIRPAPRHHARRYFHMAASTRDYAGATAMGYPNYYPNIRYFKQNGHVYCKSLDTGQIYLQQW